MSLFDSMMREFDEDPFFSSHRAHVNQMEQMLGNFMGPFGGFGFPRLMGPPEMDVHQHQRGGQERRPQHRGGAMMPFGFGQDMFGNMFGNFERMADDPNCHSYSSSSVYSYSTGDGGVPQVYQASSSTRTAPGGVKETRRTVADSESGMKKMSIGHHIGERGHIVERSQYGGHDGQQEEAQEFINLEEDDADRFNREWMQRTRRQPQVSAIQHENQLRRQYVNDEPRALPAPPSRKRENAESRHSDKNRKKWTEKVRNKAKQPKNDE